MKLTFTWNGEEGLPSKADANRLLQEAATPDWITALDFLKDVAWEAAKLYDAALLLRDKPEHSA